MQAAVVGLIVTHEKVDTMQQIVVRKYTDNIPA